MRAPTGRLLRLWLPRFGLVCVLLVSGCSDPDQPATLPDDTPTATGTSASPTPTTPEEEVEAAVRAYYAELTRAAQTNDTSVLRTLSTKGCPCYRAVRVIDRNAREGERTPEASFELTFVSVRNVEGGTASVEVKTEDAPYDVLNGSNEVVDHIEAQTTHLDLSLIETTDNKWILGNSFNLEGSE
jgi:hypothetical protein